MPLFFGNRGNCIAASVYTAYNTIYEEKNSNAHAKAIPRPKEGRFCLNDEELQPTRYLEKALQESEKECEEGYVSPAFDTAEEVIAWLNDKDARYANGEKTIV